MVQSDKCCGDSSGSASQNKGGCAEKPSSENKGVCWDSSGSASQKKGDGGCPEKLSSENKGAGGCPEKPSSENKGVCCDKSSSASQKEADRKCPENPPSENKRECGERSSSSFQKKVDGKCADKPSSEKDTKEKPCFSLKYKEDKGKCHSSQEQFKHKSSDKCQSADDELSQKDRCHSSRAAFFESGQVKEDTNTCGQSDKRYKQCPDSQFFKWKTEGENCSSSYETISNKKKSACTVSLDYSRAKEDKPPCTPTSSENLKEDSTYSKLSSYCRKLVKQCEKLKPKSKCSGIDAFQDTCEKKTILPERGEPCHPTAETGVKPARSMQQCSSKATCPQTIKPSLADFFPLDARNKQLNECIEKYMRIDPNQVLSQCSRFTNVTANLSEKCLETMKKSQLKCVGVVESSDAMRKTALMTARGRHLVTRWGPSTAMFLTTTALLTVYVTEWKTVLKHVPLYSHLGHQEDE